MKKPRISQQRDPFDLLAEEIIFIILDFLENPVDKKSFSSVCKSFYSIESKHRRALKLLRTNNLHRILTRYPHVKNLDLSSCPYVDDGSLGVISSFCGSRLQSINLSQPKFISSSGLMSFVLRCTNLVELDLSNAMEMRDSGAAAVAEAKNLERLWLARCKTITDMGVGCIAVGCSKLKLLSLKCCFGVGDLGVGLVAVKCKEIRCLDLSYMPITNECLSAITKLQYLEELALEGCFDIDDDGFKFLEQGCKSLKVLNLSSCGIINSAGYACLAIRAESLQQLTLSYSCSVTLDLANSLQKFSLLQSLKLDGCPVTTSGLEAIGNWCASLKELSLSKCQGVTDKGLSSLVIKHTDLRRLDITCCRKITYSSISCISSSCPALTLLKMESCSLVCKEAFVVIGQHCHSLTELDLTDNKIDDEGLKSISRCSKLSSLKLGICFNITDEGIAAIGRGCSNLKELDLYRCMRITDKGVTSIARGCPGLEIINIAYCYDITDNSLVSLSNCSRLNTFESRGCPLITSLGLTAISMGCLQLRKLDIKKCYNIDDFAMFTLAHFSQNLRQINLSYSSVTDAGLLSLASISCLQSMTIVHLKGLTPEGLIPVLFACQGLTKVKLQASFKRLLPQGLFDAMNARCVLLQWKDNAFQVDLDPECWKLYLDA